MREVRAYRLNFLHTLFHLQIFLRFYSDMIKMYFGSTRASKKKGRTILQMVEEAVLAMLPEPGIGQDWYGGSIHNNVAPAYQRDSEIIQGGFHLLNELRPWWAPFSMRSQK
jgi:hypothetical protein